ncbi:MULTISPECIES: hypothetical protein [unclassified Rhizobium]
MGLTKVSRTMLADGPAYYITPAQFGAVGDGIADDGAALTAMFAAVRALTQASGLIANVAINVDMTGGRYMTTTSINATMLVAWSLKIEGGLLIGRCTGKAILDLCGSRGYSLTGVSFYGDKTNRPAAAFQLARDNFGGNQGSCDNNSFIEVSTTGYFSRAAIHCYAHETTTHMHCTYFNYDPAGAVAILTGTGAYPFTSDFIPIITGSCSFVNNKFINCDFRYLPVDGVVVSAITLANPGVVTAAGHGYANGDKIVISLPGNAAWDNIVALISGVTANTFILTGINTSAKGAYPGGATAIKGQAQPSIYIDRASGMNFDCCYCVAYGNYNVALGYPDTTISETRMEQLDLDIYFEGSGIYAHYAVVGTAGKNCYIVGCRLNSYGLHAITALFDVATVATLAIIDGQISISSVVNGSCVLAAVPGKLGILGGQLTVPASLAVQVPTLSQFQGVLVNTDTAKAVSYMNSIKLVPLAADPAPLQGLTYFNSVAGKMRICEDGSAWKTVTTT